MFKKSKAARLREIGSDGRVAMLFGRLFVAELARWAYESVDVGRRLGLSRRQRQAVGLGALAAVGLTTAGLVAKRASHSSDAAAPVT